MATPPVHPQTRASTTNYGVVRLAAPGKNVPGTVLTVDDPRVKGLFGQSEEGNQPISLNQLPKHASTHRKLGADSLRLDELDDPQDNTNLDATGAVHGLMPKADKAKLDTFPATFPNNPRFSFVDAVPASSSGADGDGIIHRTTLVVYEKQAGSWTGIGKLTPLVAGDLLFLGDQLMFLGDVLTYTE